MRPALAFMTLATLCSAPAPAAEATRTLRLTLSPAAASRFAVENLAGRMRVSAGIEPRCRGGGHGPRGDLVLEPANSPSK